MRLGCCGTLDDAPAIKAAGFDFLEVNIQSVLRGDEPSSTYDKTAPDPGRLPLPVEAANCLVPGNRPIVGPQRDMAGLQDYMQRVAKRGQRMGITRFVFGSGGARKRPDNVDSHTAFEHIAQFTRMAGDVCSHHGITVVIEHLNRGETNTINRLAEALHLCNHVGHPNVQMLVDSYHYGLEHEHDPAILDLDGLLKHVHVAEPAGRKQPGFPNTPAEAFDFDHFFCLLRKIGYDDRISLECGWTAPIAEAAPPCVKKLREAWERAGKCEA